MKRKLLLLVGLAVILMLSGCKQQADSSSSNEGKIYYLEMGQLAKDDFLNIIEPYQSKYSSSEELTFNDIQKIREALRNCKLVDFQSAANIERKEVIDFHTSHGCTPSETDKIMSKLDERGNALEAYNIRNKEDQVAYFYIEKTE